MPKFSEDLKKQVGANIANILSNFIEPEWFDEYEDRELGKACFEAAMDALRAGKFKTPR